MCRFLQVSRSGYYQWLRRGQSRHRKKDQELAQKIRAIFKQSKQRYGSPRIRQELKDLRVPCSKKRVERLMREMNLRARHKRQFKVTTNSKHNYPVAQNLLNRQFQVNAPNQVWLADITYIRTFEGWLFLAAVMDLFSRKIVGWAMSESINAALATTALQMAIKRRRPRKGLLHHSDRGVQYACYAYQDVLQDNQMICSMSRKGDCWDNAPMESFFSTLKIECMDHKVYLSRSQAKREIFEFIEIDYNRKRRHSAIGGMTPENFEKQRKCA
jgi:transposase InsO family protein